MEKIDKVQTSRTQPIQRDRNNGTMIRHCKLSFKNHILIQQRGKRCSAGETLLYSTYPSSSLRTSIGGSGGDTGHSIALDSAGRIAIAGETESTDFPARNAYQASRAGNRDVFVAKFDPLAGGDASLLYSTFVGGSADDRGFALALNAPDQVFVTGRTQSSNFPLASAYDSTHAGGSCYDVFVFHLDLATNTLVYSSYPSTSLRTSLGGSAHEEGLAIAASSSGSAYVIGYTKSTDFPVLDGIQDTEGAESCAAPPSSWTTTYTYTYDPLYRLAGATYSSGEFFEYTYDAVGNRLSGTTHLSTTTYAYDDANRLADVNGVAYTWDENGNLLSDEVNTYAYDHANRLTSVVGPSSSSSYAYNGLGDRLQGTVDSLTTNYSLDLNTWLTQVLADGTNTYLYGSAR